jgi:hypothetical protein
MDLDVAFKEKLQVTHDVKISMETKTILILVGLIIGGILLSKTKGRNKK